MKNVTLTKIRKEIQSAGGEYKKEKFLLNSQPAYTVNGVTMTKAQMIMLYKLGLLYQRKASTKA